MTRSAFHKNTPASSEPKFEMQNLIANLALVNGKSICHANMLDVAGYHRVTIQRTLGEYTEHFYLDDDERCEDFIIAAIGKLCQPGEDPNQIRQELRALVRAKRDEYFLSNDHLRIERLSEAVPYEVAWLWPDRIAADKLTMLVGDPGVGKSLVSLDIAARVSTGRPWPDEPTGTRSREPGNVILLAELDDADDTIRPRLQALGADLERINLIRSFMRASPEGASENLPFSVGGKLEMLAACLRRVPDCKLIVIDPLSAYLETNYSRRDLAALTSCSLRG